VKLDKKAMEIILARAYAVTKSAEHYGRLLTLCISKGKMSVRSWSAASQGVAISGVAVESGEDAEFVVDAGRLYSVLKKMPKAEFEMKVDATAIKVASGRLRYSIHRPTEADDGESQVITEPTFRVMGDDMIRALKRISPSADTADTYGPYEGVFAKSDGGRVLLTATDRKSIAYAEFKTATPCRSFEAILPKEFLDFLSVFDPESFVDVQVDDGKIMAKQDHALIWCGLLAGQYKNLSEATIREGVNQRGGGTSVKVEVRREDFVEMLSHVEVVADRDSMRTTLTLGNGEIEAACVGASGTCSDSCAATGDAGAAKVDMSIDSMRKVVMPLAAETITMEFFTATPVIFVESVTDNFKAFCAGMQDRAKEIVPDI